MDTCDFHPTATWSGDFCKLDIDKTYDACWCSHVLEHQENVHYFLKKITKVVRPGGIVCVTVPPLKHNVVGGHLTLWNAGLLIYNLVVAGIDCSSCKAKRYGYNISVIFYNNAREEIELCLGGPDLAKLKRFFPIEIQWQENTRGNLFDGDISEPNWDEIKIWKCLNLTN